MNRNIFWWYKHWTDGYYLPVARNWKESIMFVIIRIVRKLKGKLDIAA